MSKHPPRISVCGERAVNSDLPLWVRDLAGVWRPGTEHTRPRAKRFIALGYGYATWVYGVEDPTVPVTRPL